jgi:hypothetical protein
VVYRLPLSREGLRFRFRALGEPESAVRNARPEFEDASCTGGPHERGNKTHHSGGPQGKDRRRVHGLADAARPLRGR